MFDEDKFIFEWRLFLTRKFEETLEIMKRKVADLGPYKMFVRGEYEMLCNIVDKLIQMDEAEGNALFVELSRNMKKSVDGLYGMLK